MQKKILLLLCLFMSGIAGVIFAQREGFGYISVTFLTGAGETGYLQMSATGGDGSSFSVNFFNPTDVSQTIKMDFFDQIMTADGENKKACNRIHTADDFASTLLWDTGTFVVSAHSGATKIVTLNYGYCSSGLDLGCLVQLPTGSVDMGSFDAFLGKANFIDLQIQADTFNCGKYTVKALPSYRSDSFDSSGFIALWINDNYANMTGNNSSVTGMIDISSEGIGTFTYGFPNNGSGYMVLLKVPSYLSVGYTGIFDSGNGSGLDFTHRTALASYIYSGGWFDKVVMENLPAVQGFSGERSLLVVGDVNENDYIGASDLALINSHLTVNFNPTDSAYDFDRNEYITSKDQAIMIQNVQRNGFRRYFKNTLSSGLLTGNDVGAGSGEFPRN